MPGTQTGLGSANRRLIMSNVRLWIPAVAAAALLALSAPLPASAQDVSDRFSAFAVHAESGPEIDYSALSVIFRNVVYDVPMSDRQVVRSRVERTGTRLVRQSESRYRYEGNRLMLHVLNDENKAIIASYRGGLEDIARQVDLASLTRDEQLAFWFNLHNIIVLDELARAYPVSSPQRIRLGPDNTSLHDTPVVEAGGTRLSLRDIRENIVYRHWDDPRVIYGFHTGAVGSPQLRRQAYTGSEVWSMLDANAREFVNALRGVEDNTTPRISPVYETARPHFFADWPADLYAHLGTFAGAQVSAILANGGEPRFLAYDDNLADLTNGAGPCATASLYGGSVSRPNEGGLADSGTGCQADSEIVRDFFDNVALRRQRMSSGSGDVSVRDVPEEAPSD